MTESEFDLSSPAPEPFLYSGQVGSGTCPRPACGSVWADQAQCVRDGAMSKSRPSGNDTFSGILLETVLLVCNSICRSDLWLGHHCPSRLLGEGPVIGDGLTAWVLKKWLLLSSNIPLVSVNEHQVAEEWEQPLKAVQQLWFPERMKMGVQYVEINCYVK